MEKVTPSKVVIIPRPPAEAETESTPIIAAKSMPVPPPAPKPEAPAEAPEAPAAQTSPDPASLPAPKPPRRCCKRPVKKEGLPGKPVKK